MYFLRITVKKTSQLSSRKCICQHSETAASFIKLHFFIYGLDSITMNFSLLEFALIIALQWHNSDKSLAGISLLKQSIGSGFETWISILSVIAVVFEVSAQDDCLPFIFLNLIGRWNLQFYTSFSTLELLSNGSHNSQGTVNFLPY